MVSGLFAQNFCSLPKSDKIWSPFVEANLQMAISNPTAAA
jgi:hypothetical protein